MTRWAPWVVSLALHGAVFGAGAGLVTRPAAVSVTSGPTSVALVFQVPEERPATPEVEVPLPRPAPPTPRASVSSIEQVGAEDESPRYAQNVPPPYPREAYLKDIQGTVWLLAEVDAVGRPRAVTVERSSGSLVLDEAAAMAVRGWRFTPARRFGRSVASRCRMPIQFRIEETF
ncbi:MAG: energy transducer TonB [Candidatus Omnitrophica bacterium]|nr:energy transducer TonB [Candidatus Omnitrophota bacterium]